MYRHADCTPTRRFLSTRLSPFLSKIDILDRVTVQTAWYMTVRQRGTWWWSGTRGNGWGGTDPGVLLCPPSGSVSGSVFGSSPTVAVYGLVVPTVAVYGLVVPAVVTGLVVPAVVTGLVVPAVVYGLVVPAVVYGLVVPAVVVVRVVVPAVVVVRVLVQSGV